MYPLTMDFPAIVAGEPVTIYVVIDRDGWQFAGRLWRVLFEDLTVSERLRLRREFAAQVELAQNTPTKGDA